MPNYINKILIISKKLLWPFEYIKFYFKITKSKEKRKILLMLTPEFGNIGDHAINYAQQSFIKENYKEFAMIEITFNESKKFFGLIKKRIKTNDIILLNGGGNIGDLYTNIEMERRKIIITFKKNRIISMPQSINYSETENGKNELKKTINAFSQNKNLIIIARDDKSYDFAKNNFKKNKVYLLPDIVLYWAGNKQIIRNRTKEVLVLLRNDKEASLKDNIKNNIFNSLEKNNFKYRISDTHTGKNLKGNKRKLELENKLKEIRESKFIVTDRFHGVIFSVITKTPCIAFKSKDHKIEEGVKWFKRLNYIFYLGEDTDRIEEALEKISTLNEQNIEIIDFKEMILDLFNKENLIE